ncbi:hypothetical protein VFPPC_17503 [Pochonia chlamydosporia 170]|uniref:Uncharacterized protein n=1 Tax=Pochonia chlamydosporia 170 TaxID=1380566 RepID=A0A219ASP9_METCM|nr:hypothetical protein VFPPC_17503 [Pochonia chlamydosporia 170]OWT43334.1 hypothetical protein VFPPC_17503 [Pochonia chlamydosporia 170]
MWIEPWLSALVAATRLGNVESIAIDWSHLALCASDASDASAQSTQWRSIRFISGLVWSGQVEGAASPVVAAGQLVLDQLISVDRTLNGPDVLSGSMLPGSPVWFICADAKFPSSAFPILFSRCTGWVAPAQPWPAECQFGRQSPRCGH